MSNWIFAGFERALLGFRDSNGISTGQQSTLANGATSGAYVADLPYSASYQALPPVNLNIEGGDILYTIIQFGNSKTQPFDLIMPNFDTTLSNLISGAASNNTNAQAEIVSMNPNRGVPRLLWLGLQYRAEDKLTGALKYCTQFFPSCQMRIADSGPTYQAKHDIIVHCTPQMASTAIDGRGFGTSGLAMNLQNDQTDNYFYFSANPIHVVSFRQDAAATTFNTVYKPISTVVTLNNTPNSFLIGATPTALSAITLAGLATLTAAGSAAIADVLMHETAFVPV